MTITREQVADLEPGDTVELELRRSDDAVVMAKGNLVAFSDSGALFFAGYCVRDRLGTPAYAARRTLTFVAQAPRPLYVNHQRTEPVAGDVVRDADNEDDTRTWRRRDVIWSEPDLVGLARDDLPARLRLLVDGETGQVVPGASR